MTRLDRWEDTLEREHPLAYFAVFAALFLSVLLIVGTLLYLLVPQVPAT